MLEFGGEVFIDSHNKKRGDGEPEYRMTFGEPSTKKKTPKRGLRRNKSTIGTKKNHRFKEDEKKKNARMLTELYKRSRSQKILDQKEPRSGNNSGISDYEIEREITNFDRTLKDLKKNEYYLRHMNPDHYGIDSNSPVRKKDLKRLNSFKKSMTPQRGIPSNYDNLVRAREKRKKREKEREMRKIKLLGNENDEIEDMEKNFSPIFQQLKEEYRERSTNKKGKEKKKRKLHYFKNRFKGETDAEVGLDMLHTNELMGYYQEVVDKGKRDFIQHHRKQNVLKKIEYG